MLRTWSLTLNTWPLTFWTLIWPLGMVLTVEYYTLSSQCYMLSSHVFYMLKSSTCTGPEFPQNDKKLKLFETFLERMMKI